MEESESEKFFLELPSLEEKLFILVVKSHGKKEGCYFFLWGEAPWKEGRLLFFGG